jgi:hypothetical protein
VRARPRRRDASGRREALVVPQVEDEVVGDGERADETVLVAVLGDVSDTGAQDVLAAEHREVALAEEDTPPRSDRPQPVMASTSAVWPLPSTPAIATISPRGP